ncbi:radical SAM protein [Actinoplanes sp. N902-109]|uniref:radical SAM protein n=1 Tax=Actinoplanes sp. (strain N902-109) TaxID=649831 RepID=UPI0005A13050|nr:radical SAM protein [Actinoplanes sp. N902-109]
MQVDITPPLPRHLQLEITSACNLRCTMCLVRYRPPVNKLAGAMPLDLFTRLVGEVPGLNRLTLQGLGEPLLSPYLPEMIRVAVADGITVGFNSNATLLTERRARELVASRVDWLHVSLDGADAATFEGIRDGATFDTVVANLAGLVTAKRAAGSSTPWIRVVFVAMRQNVGQLPALVRLLSSIGVDELHVQNLSHSFSDTDPAGSYAGIRAFAADQALWTGADEARAGDAFAQARQEAAAAGLRLRLPVTGAPAADEPRGCSWPWDAAYITSAGVVQPCCMVMGDDRVALGDLTERSFPEIWSGPAYQDFRRRLTGTEPPEVCRGCSLYRRAF